TVVLALANPTFQLWHIYIFFRSKVLVGFLMVAILATCGIGIVSAIEAWIFSEHAELVALLPVIAGSLALQCALDILIAIILCTWFSRSKTNFGKTDKVLNRLIRMAVQSGSFTALFALGTILSIRFSPRTNMTALFALPIGCIYTHTMMDHLVSREQLRSMLSSGRNSITIPS
ncbi:hypothetical protein B0H13DRAFT_2513009, partial [Mycena leptocephala]